MMQRFAITRLSEDGARAFCFGNQGRHFYDDRQSAEAALEGYRRDLEVKLGFRDLLVEEVRCYDNGDAVSG